MNEVLEPAGIARRLLLRRVIGTGIVIVIGSRMAVAADARARVYVEEPGLCSRYSARAVLI